MPIAGSVGAVSAANRAVRTRHNSGLGKDTRGRNVPVAPPPYGRLPTVTKGRDVPGATSSESSPGMVAMLKRQVCVFKKHHQALTEKVHKGLAMTGMTSGVKMATSFKSFEQSKAVAAVGANSSTVKQTAKQDEHSNPAWFAAFEEMGFEASKIREVVAATGNHPEQVDDVLQVLLAMQGCNEQASGSTAPADRAAPDSAASVSRPVPKPLSPCPTPPSLDMSACGFDSEGMTVCSGPLAAQLEPTTSPSAPSLLPSLSACGSVEFESVANRCRRNQPSAAVPTPQPRVLSDRDLSHFQQMGFAPGAIHQAAAMLDQSSTIDELFDMLVAMGAPISPQRSSTASSSTDVAPFAIRASGLKQTAFSLSARASTMREVVRSPQDVVLPATAAAVAAELVEDVPLVAFAGDSRSDAADLVYDVGLDSLSSYDGHPEGRDCEEEPTASAIDDTEETDAADDEAMPPGACEDTVRALASAVVASAIANASIKAGVLPGEREAKPKHVAEERVAALPVRGGA